jgi:hypothetical protein
MIYLPGRMHEKLQTEMFLELNVDFNIPISGERRLFDIDVDTLDKLDLESGDVIVSRWFKPISRYF